MSVGMPISFVDTQCCLCAGWVGTWSDMVTGNNLCDRCFTAYNKPLKLFKGSNAYAGLSFKEFVTKLGYKIER